jgi:hypothetical protein
MTTSLNVFFYGYLLYTWLVWFERYYAENGQKKCNTQTMWKKWIISCMIFVGIVAYSLHACMYAFDPGF